MIWILIVIFFTKTEPYAQAKTEPTLQACVADMALIHEAMTGSPPPDGLLAVEDKCFGPLPDPTVQKDAGP